jgi:hypothetical protein
MMRATACDHASSRAHRFRELSYLKARGPLALLGGDPTSRSESRNLSLHMQSEGLRAVQEEGREIVRARERQLAENDGA